MSVGWISIVGEVMGSKVKGGSFSRTRVCYCSWREKRAIVGLYQSPPIILFPDGRLWRREKVVAQISPHLIILDYPVCWARLDL